MNQNSQVTIFSATKVDFDYELRIDDAQVVKDSGSILIKELKPSEETIRSEVETYVANKAVNQLIGSSEANADISIKITKISRIATKVKIAKK